MSLQYLAKIKKKQERTGKIFKKIAHELCVSYGVVCQIFGVSHSRILIFSILNNAMLFNRSVLNLVEIISDVPGDYLFIYWPQMCSQ